MSRLGAAARAPAPRAERATAPRPRAPRTPEFQLLASGALLIGEDKPDDRNMRTSSRDVHPSSTDQNSSMRRASSSTVCGSETTRATCGKQVLVALRVSKLWGALTGKGRSGPVEITPPTTTMRRTHTRSSCRADQRLSPNLRATSLCHVLAERLSTFAGGSAPLISTSPL